MLIFAYDNTPLGAAIGSDNAMYLTMGTALAKGYAPYTEIFDHKGPLLFLLQLLPQAVSGGYSLTAIFIQETLVLFACLMMMRAIAKELDVCPWAAQDVYKRQMLSTTAWSWRRLQSARCRRLSSSSACKRVSRTRLRVQSNNGTMNSIKGGCIAEYSACQPLFLNRKEKSI